MKLSFRDNRGNYIGSAEVEPTNDYDIGSDNPIGLWFSVAVAIAFIYGVFASALDWKYQDLEYAIAIGVWWPLYFFPIKLLFKLIKYIFKKIRRDRFEKI